MIPGDNVKCEEKPEYLSLVPIAADPESNVTNVSPSRVGSKDSTVRVSLIPNS